MFGSLQPHAEAVQTLRKLLARYAEAFPDARAAYALVLWDQGERVEAEPSSQSLDVFG